MLNPETLFNANADLIDDQQLRGLPLLAGFTGFVDAGHVVSQVIEEMLSALDHELVAVFDADQLIDYRSRRPRITFAEDHLADYHPPRLELHRVYDGMGVPFLLLAGFEPDLQWERFITAVAGLIDRLEVPLVSWINSIPMPVPHTRPLGVTVHGNRSDLIEGMNTWRPTAELQASVGHLLELRLIESGHDVVGYVVHVPHYLAEAEYPPAAVTALEYLGASASLVLPTDRLREAGRDVERQIARQVDGSAEVSGVVSTLEKRFDERAGSVERRSLLVKDNSELADADEIGAAVEAYLASPQAADESVQLLEEDRKAGDAAGAEVADVDIADANGAEPDGDGNSGR
ncbi:proteasome assembly chaperone family protein [Arthrobacter sp. TMN-50]